ncbi:hypothetical protein GGR55DRAFT_391327 [Xylaria sp. FL0064]|nr:hypothetical protein GGR55DRAFT_391327 [Xylaria sp. FL0064]
MRRRNSANPPRIDRRKSAASVKSVHLEHIPPETAERDARVAATQAFARARARSATDSNSPLWPPARSLHPKTRSDGAPPNRQQSVRFVQPRPCHPAPTSVMVRGGSTSSRASHGQTCHGTNAQVDLRPSSSASASGMVCATKGAAGDYINTLFASDEYYTPEDDIASMPSSYRKLRKSRSMFTNRPRATVSENSNLDKSSVSANQLPLPAKSYFQGDENMPPRRLKAPKSMSFLRDFRDNFVPAFRSENDATTILTSTNGYNTDQDGAKGDLRPRSSRFFRSRAPSEDRVFRKSMRDTSNSTVSTNSAGPKEGSLRYKARRVSQGLKHKLKNLFAMSKSDVDNATLPLQHIDAQRSHIFGWSDSQHGTNDEPYHVPSTNQAALSHVSSGVPSLHAVPSYQQLRSRQGSMESLRSEQKASDERSRVTSWSNSDANTVITHNSYREEREKKRLSIINEHGAHVCSSSAQFATISERSNASTTPLCQPVHPAPMVVDRQRIYSALMKRIGHSQEAHASNPELHNSAEDIVHLGTVPRRRSSLRLRRLGRDPAATIRYVFPESETDSDSVNEEIRQDTKDKDPSFKASLSAANRTNEWDRGASSSISVNTNAEDTSSRHGHPEGAPPLVRTLSSRSSAFFGSPTRHLFRAESPYRRALQDRINTTPYEQQSIKSPDFNPWMRSLSNLPNFPLRRSSTHGSDADVKLHYTESIYSTNTEDGQTQRHSVLSVVEDIQRPTSTHGDATIFVNPSGQNNNKRCASLPPKQRVTSSSSSVEWKMWLSSNVSKLEETTKQVDANDFKYSLSSTRISGHVRENAQINDDDEDHVPDPPDTPCRAREKRDSVLNLNGDDEVGDQPTPFDAGEKDIEIEKSRIGPAQPFPTNLSSASIILSPVANCKEATPSASTGFYAASREKALPEVPSADLEAIKPSGHDSIATSFKGYQSTIKNNMTPLTSRSISTVGEGQQGKTTSSANSRRKLYSMTPTKAENMSPSAVGDDDPYGIEGTGVLGPSRQTVGSRRMVDIFLSSRRRRMTSSEEGSVFL